MTNYRTLTEYKDKIIHAASYDEALSILDIALTHTSDNTEKKLLESLVNKNTYSTKMELGKLIIYLETINMIQYYNDAEKIIEDIENNINDPVQIKTLKRLIASKPVREISDFNDDKSFYKTCPYCNQKSYGSVNHPYMICGYNNKGFDYKGCGRDWCFKCGKKLCKNWNRDSLFMIENRSHDSNCCRMFALKNNMIYPDEFCICSITIDQKIIN